MDLQNQFNLMVNQKQWWQAGDQVVVAVSTGVDSMTLLHLLMNLPIRDRPKIIVAYVDHQLRSQSTIETHYIYEFCQSNGIRLEKTVWSRKDHPQSGVEAAARTFRYRFFEKVLTKTGSRYLLTAHHGDDLAETVLMKLVRGGQLSSLIGIQENRNFLGKRLIRPLLGFSKHQLHQFAVAKGIKWYEDATNNELTLQRNRIRHEVVPLLKQESPKFLSHIHRFAEQLTVSLETLSELTDPIINRMVVFDDQTARISLEYLSSYSPSVVQTIIEQVLEQRLRVPNISIEQVTAIVHLIGQDQSPQAELDLAAGWHVLREYRVLIIYKEHQNFVDKPEKSRPFMVILDRWYSLNRSTKFGVFSEKHSSINGKASILYLSNDDLPLVVRPVSAGDRISIGHGKHQKVSRTLINAKVPNPQRRHVRILATKRDKVLSVLGLKNSAVPQNKTNLKRYWLIEINENIISERKGISDE